MVKVSVIMPVYNAEKYLRTAMDSLLKQTLKEIEIICVDDGSTDSSYDILLEYMQKDPRIIILRERNSYAGTARNYGMTVATGEYLSFLDADDYFKPEMLEEAYACAKKEAADVVVFGGKYFKENIENSYHVAALLREDILPLGDGFYKEELFDVLMHFTIGCPWNKLFRRKYIEETGIKFQPFKRVNDVYFVETAIALSKRVGLVRKALIYYRTDNQQSLQGTKRENPLQFFQVFSDIRICLEKNGLYKKIEKSYINLFAAECIYTLEQISDEEGFLLVYNKLKNDVLGSIGIKDIAEEDFYRKEDYRKCMAIRNCTPIEYLMKKKPDDTAEKNYVFPYEYVKKGSRIILYAAGRVGTDFYSQLKKTGYCSVLAWVDKSVRGKKLDGSDIEIRPADGVDYDLCDLIVLAVEDRNLANRIRKYLNSTWNVPDEKIIWCDPVYRIG